MILNICIPYSHPPLPFLGSVLYLFYFLLWVKIPDESDQAWDSVISAGLDMQIPFIQLDPAISAWFWFQVANCCWQGFFFYCCAALDCPCSCELSKYWGFGVLILHHITVVVLNLAQVGCCRDHLVCGCEELLKVRHTGNMKYKHL